MAQMALWVLAADHDQRLCSQPIRVQSLGTKTKSWSASAGNLETVMLEGDKSPLKILCSKLVMGLDSDQLETIAGENGERRISHLCWSPGSRS
jgi:hypothetical protein